MSAITANELKTKGIKTINEKLTDSPEAIITVRGKKRYVVMDIKHYQYLRECELEAALMEAKSDLEAGRVVVDSVTDHIKRLTDKKI